jgi:hypothetical protein
LSDDLIFEDIKGVLEVGDSVDFREDRGIQYKSQDDKIFT